MSIVILNSFLAGDKRYLQKIDTDSEQVAIEDEKGPVLYIDRHGVVVVPGQGKLGTLSLDYEKGCKWVFTNVKGTGPSVEWVFTGDLIRSEMKLAKRYFTTGLRDDK